MRYDEHESQSIYNVHKYIKTSPTHTPILYYLLLLHSSVESAMATC
jgi:hypothetical protein